MNFVINPFSSRYTRAVEENEDFEGDTNCLLRQWIGKEYELMHGTPTTGLFTNPQACRPQSLRPVFLQISFRGFCLRGTEKARRAHLQRGGTIFCSRESVAPTKDARAYAGLNCVTRVAGMDPVNLTAMQPLTH
jgi:hypothetical protein